jgi:cell division protein FtsB
LGAFILIAIIALPYYLKVEPVLKKLKIAENNIKQLEIKNQTLKDNVEECNENQKKCEEGLIVSPIKAKKKRKVVKPVKKEETIFIEKKKSRSTILN